MVNFCAVVGCGNRADRDKGKGFYRLPSLITHQGQQTHALSERRRTQWIARIRRKDLKVENYPYVRVCSDHFLSGRPAGLYEHSNPDWAPSVKLGYDLAEGNADRHSRAARRSVKRKVLDRESPAASVPKEAEVCEDNGKAVQTDLTWIAGTAEFSQVELQAVKKELDDAKEELEEMKGKCETLSASLVESTQDLREDSFKQNDNKVCFYTGLPNWDVFCALITFVQPCFTHEKGRHSSLSPFQQVLMTLMRLRLGLQVQDLAYRFQIHKSTVSRIFLQVIDILYARLKPLIIWPDRENLRKTLPMDFRKHSPNCTVIIDCFDVFLERPTNLLARAQTYSSYKHHNTVKYLIGITPQGTVSFISEGWGGRVSDKHLTESCGILEKLLPGDTILADRGFDITDSVGLYCATIKIPAFTRGKKQLTGIEIEQTRRIANVRIHVERVIGNVRQKYSLLSATQPIDFVISRDNVTTLDKIVYVSCALNNMCDSVVPFD